MIRQIIICAASFIFFVLLDLVWIGVIARKHYVHHLAPVLRYKDGRYQVIWWAALLVWLCIVLGSYIFVLPRTIDGTFFDAYLYGGLFGLMLYGVYDFTNLSLLKHWPLITALIDIVWGVFANGVLAAWMLFVYRVV